ncbi:MAG: hypothetical protein PHD21_01425 [Flavobacteriales bacterium]|nr:hypothetical protein [Flavobacteriales bacterium]
MKPNEKPKILIVVFLVSFFLNSLTLLAQQTANEYLKEANIFSRLYTGQIADKYNPMVYQGTPYYGGDNYTTGTVVFSGVEYVGLNIFIDMYKKQLVVLNHNNFPIIIPHQKVEKVLLHGNTFQWIDITAENGLKNDGYYILFFQGEKLSLLCEEYCDVREEKIIPITFETKERLYLNKGGKYYRVNSKGDIIKLFPEYKKEINEYSKERHLDFSGLKIQSMIELTAMCDKL